MSMRRGMRISYHDFSIVDIIMVTYLNEFKVKNQLYCLQFKLPTLV